MAKGGKTFLRETQHLTASSPILLILCNHGNSGQLELLSLFTQDFKCKISILR